MLEVFVTDHGFSIIEIVIAMAIGVMMITAVEIAAFGNQTSLTSSVQSAEVVSGARTLIEEVQSLARKDFNLVNPTSTISDYTKSVSVTLQPDFVTKLVTTRVTMTENPAIATSYMTLVTNIENVNSPDTCDSTPSGDWSNPRIASSTISSLLGTTSLFSISDVDAYKGKVYVTSDRRSYKTDPVLFIIDASIPSHPVIDTNFSNKASATLGPTALRVADDFLAHKRYAYLASKNSSLTHTPQFQIMDVTDGTISMVSTTTTGGGDGNAISYHDGYVYLGLTSEAAQELQIIDVHSPASPVWKGGYSLGHDANSIIVRDRHAYIASPGSENMAVLDVIDPMHPSYLGGYTSPYPPGVGSNYGERLYLVGDSIYLGRSFGTNELYVLDVSDPTSISAQSSFDIGTNNQTSIYGLRIRDDFAFIASKTKFIVLHRNADNSFTAIASTTLPSSATSMDCEGNTLYVGSNDVSGNGWISIISPG
ncbi:hypothetical protein HY968_02220 [Candidatus Kaiserbacteria bacterium]|nr:hypothetical protein [Candidatus Kaiserbacteria bacterium]